MKKNKLISPDGLTEVKEIVHGGITFHLPPWIPEDEFRAGLDSTEDGEALSSVVNIKLKGWTNEYDYEIDDNRDFPIFKVTAKVPFNSARELVVNRFTPHHFNDYTITIQDDGVVVKFLVTEYRDFNDVQVFVLPMNFREHPFPGNDEWVEETFDELSANFEEPLRKKLYWDGPFQEFTHNGEEYFLQFHIHED